MSFSRPPPLKPGDDIAVVAPAGPFDRESFDRGLATLATRYRPKFGEDLYTRTRYLAGSDDRRLDELLSAWTSDAKALLAARGGYGLMRLLPKLDIAKLPHKLVIGFSDITALHCALQRERRVSIHAPVLTQLGRQPNDVVERLWRILESDAPAPPLHGTHTFVPGRVEGRLLGGNLSVFTRLLGTPWMPELDGAILLLEDVGERPYRLDRMWTHLKLAGVFDRIRGIALGEFTLCEEKDESYSSADILRELARETGLPCVAGLPVGHGEVNQPVPLGVQVRLDAEARTLEFLEPAVGSR